MLHLNCTALSQSESSNFFMYIIRCGIHLSGSEFFYDICYRLRLKIKYCLQHRFPEQKSNETFLSKCHFSLVEMHMVQYGGKDSASVGIKLSNGTYERPIGKNRLLWVRPGKGFSQTKAWK